MDNDAIGRGTTSMIPRTATVPPASRSAALVALVATDPAPERTQPRVQTPAKTTAHNANVAQYWDGESSVSASSVLEAGATTSYANDVRRLAVSGASGWATSTSGGNEKAAVITSVAVTTSG